MAKKTAGEKFVTIGDIEEEMIVVNNQRKKQAQPVSQHRRDISVPKTRKQDGPEVLGAGEVNATTQRSVNPAPSEYAITAKLDGISERPSSDFGSKISSGLGHETQKFINVQKMKEIRHYVAHEIYRCQKKSDALYKDFDRLKKMKQDLIDTENVLKVGAKDDKTIKKLSGKTSLKEADIQIEVVRKSLKRIQQKYEILKKMKENMKKAEGLNQYDSQHAKLEAEILSQYEYLRNKTRIDSQKAKQKFDETASSMSIS